MTLAESAEIIHVNGLEISNINGITVLESHYGVHQCGTISLLDMLEVEQTFLVRNSNNVALSDLHLQYPSGSLRMSVSIPDDPILVLHSLRTGSILPPVQPRNEISIQVVVDLVSLTPGPFSKSVTIFSPSDPQSKITLEMRGTLKPSITFLPYIIDFGSTPSAKTVTHNLTVRLDPRLLTNGSTPKLFCSNPEIIIDPIPVEEYAKSKSRLLTKEQQTAGLFSYRLTVPSTAPIGQVSGSLFIPYIEPSSRAGASTVPPDMQLRVTRALKSASAVLTGQVVGDLSVSPLGADLGTVVAGKVATRQLVLTGKNTTTFNNIQINSSSPWLSARWIVPNHPAPAAVTIGLPARQTLEVILDASTPPGTFNSQLTLTLANGQHLVLPVTATVIGSAH